MAFLADGSGARPSAVSHPGWKAKLLTDTVHEGRQHGWFSSALITAATRAWNRLDQGLRPDRCRLT